jgi:hypothetical protein
VRTDTAKELIGRYFPGWKVMADEVAIGISNGKHRVAEPLKDVLESTSPWYLIDLAYAVEKLNGGQDWTGARKKIESRWSQEPV